MPHKPGKGLNVFSRELLIIKGILQSTFYKIHNRLLPSRITECVVEHCHFLFNNYALGTTYSNPSQDSSSL